jgi:integrase
MHIRSVQGKTPNTVNTSVVRTRRYLTGREVEKLIEAARKHGRYGHRDATMILIGYRHGLRASELCDLQWSQMAPIDRRPRHRSLSYVPRSVAMCGHGMVAAVERQPWLDRLHRRDVGSVPRKAK